MYNNTDLDGDGLVAKTARTRAEPRRACGCAVSRSRGAGAAAEIKKKRTRYKRACASLSTLLSPRPRVTRPHARR